MATTAYPNTQSILQSSSGKNRTGVALSTMVIVKANQVAVGAIQSINISETRPLKMFSEVGTDGIIDSSPTGSTTYSGSCDRLRYDGIRIFEAFGCGFLHLKSMRIPIDIEIIDRYTAATQADTEKPENAIITILKNVWFKNLSYTYSQDNWQVSEKADFEFETIYSYITGNPSQPGIGVGPRKQPSLLTDPYMVSADTGGRRGALDLPGLISMVVPSGGNYP